MMLRKISAIAALNRRTWKVLTIGICCLAWVMGTYAIFAENVAVLHVERFDEGLQWDGHFMTIHSIIMVPVSMTKLPTRVAKARCWAKVTCRGCHC